MEKFAKWVVKNYSKKAVLRLFLAMTICTLLLSVGAYLVEAHSGFLPMVVEGFLNNATIWVITVILMFAAIVVSFILPDITHFLITSIASAVLGGILSSFVTVSVVKFLSAAGSGESVSLVAIFFVMVCVLYIVSYASTKAFTKALFKKYSPAS